MKSYSVVRSNNEIILSATFAKKVDRLEADAVGLMTQLRKVFPSFQIRVAQPRNAKSNHTSYAVMEAAFEAVKRDDLLQELSERRKASYYTANGKAVYDYNFFENRKWFGQTCQENDITPGFVKQIETKLREAKKKKTQPNENSITLPPDTTGFPKDVA